MKINNEQIFKDELIRIKLNHSSILILMKMPFSPAL